MEGYEVKREGPSRKNILFCAPGQEKGTRGNTIGPKYTESAIRERIAHKDKEPELLAEETEVTVLKVPKKKQTASEVKGQVVSKQKGFPSKRINLLVDISQNLKAQQSKAY